MRNKLSIKPKHLPNRSNGDQYFYIDDFNQVNEKDCMQYDKMNDKIYLEQLKMFNQIIKKIKMSNIRIIEQPPPPNRPNNYEKLILWRKRHERLSVEDQTISILYLLSKNIKIKLPNIYEDGIEPYEAIKQSNQLSNKSREDKYIVAKEFMENFISNNKFDFSDNSDSEEILGFNFLSRETSTDTEEDINNDINNDTNKMRCKHPEHHHLEDKVEHFNKLNKLHKTGSNIFKERKSCRRQRGKSTSLYPDIDENKTQLPMNMNVNVNLDREKDNYFRSFRNSRIFIPNNYNEPIPSAPTAPPTYN